jgi:hypothetical protein
MKEFVKGRSMGKQGLTEAFREALAQPAQEPVAWGVFEGNNLHDMFFTGEEAQELAELKGSHAKVRPLYDAPLQPSQEPDELTIAYMSGLYDGKKAEREAFAKICDEFCYGSTKILVEKAIRARGNT